MKILLILASFAGLGLWTFCFVHAVVADAVQQCSTLHHLDLSKLQTNGTEFTAGGCTLKCMIEGKLVSSDPIDEGSNCNVVPNGVCLNGTCVHQIAHPNVTTAGPTSPPTPAPVNPFFYTFDQLSVTIQHSILHQTLKETDVMYIDYHLNDRYCVTKSYFPLPNIEWHSSCLFKPERDHFPDDSDMHFYLYVNGHSLADDRIPIVLAFRKYLVVHPNSATNETVEFAQVFHLTSDNNSKYADLYVKFTFHNVKQVSD